MKHVLDYAFSPRSIAVAGASDQPFSFGHHFLKHLIDYKFGGEIYPINPAREHIQGLKAYPSLSTVPGDVDLVICCVPASQVAPLLEECPAKNVKVMHVFTARLSETGRVNAQETEKQIKLKAEKAGVRLIGPNCMGLYNPAANLSFGYELPPESGDIGAMFQSGGAMQMLIQFGGLQGLRFSKAVSYGNALDINESDLLDYMAEDKGTAFIAAYFEGVKNGREFMHALKRAAAVKPVVAIKGGRSNSGSRAVSSHTASIAGSQNLWSNAFSQAGVIEVKDINEMINVLMLFKWLPPIKGRKAGIIGGGGGKAVMAADLAEEAGLLVPSLSAEMRNKLREIVPTIWDWLSNPIDFSIWGDDAVHAGRIPELFSSSTDFDFIIGQVSDDNPLPPDISVSVVNMEVDTMVKVAKNGKKPFIAVLTGARPGYSDLENERWKTYLKLRSKLVSSGVPTFDTFKEAVNTLAKFISYWQNKS